MFDTIEDIRETRKRYNSKMFQSGVPAFRQSEDKAAAALGEGALPVKYKELIALGISIVEKCYPCVEYHISVALEQGATRQEIQETAGIAVTLGGTCASWPARFAFKVLDDLEEKKR